MDEVRDQQVNPFTLFLILILLILSFPDENPIKQGIRKLMFGRPQPADHETKPETNSTNDAKVETTAANTFPIPPWRYKWKVAERGVQR